MPGALLMSSVHLLQQKAAPQSRPVGSAEGLREGTWTNRGVQGRLREACARHNRLAARSAYIRAMQQLESPTEARHGS